MPLLTTAVLRQQMRKNRRWKLKLWPTALNMKGRAHCMTALIIPPMPAGRSLSTGLAAARSQMAVRAAALLSCAVASERQARIRVRSSAMPAAS